MTDPIAQHYAQLRRDAIARGSVSYEDMTLAEMREHVANFVGDNPDVLQRDGNINADGSRADGLSFTEEQGQAMLDAQQARFERKAHERLKGEAEDLRFRLREAGVSEDAIEASVNGLLVSRGTTPGAFRRAEAAAQEGNTKSIEDMTLAELRSSIKAMPNSAFGAAASGDEG